MAMPRSHSHGGFLWALLYGARVWRPVGIMSAPQLLGSSCSLSSDRRMRIAPWEGNMLLTTLNIAWLVIRFSLTIANSRFNC
eukprot:SAG11_NODE_734_length_7466_cov_3.388625_3_plen_82_part_00